MAPALACAVHWVWILGRRAKRITSRLLDRQRALHAGLLMGVHAAEERVAPGLQALEVESRLPVGDLFGALGRPTARLHADVVRNRRVRVAEVDGHVSRLRAQGGGCVGDRAGIGCELDRTAGRGRTRRGRRSGLLGLALALIVAGVQYREDGGPADEQGEIEDGPREDPSVGRKVLESQANRGHAYGRHDQGNSEDVEERRAHAAGILVVAPTARPIAGSAWGSARVRRRPALPDHSDPHLTRILELALDRRRDLL